MTEFSLRERKYAQTKSDLLHAVLEALDHKTLDEISVREICEAVPVSAATFFNYFSTKRDVLAYYLQLWMVRVRVRVRNVIEETESGIRAVEAIFDETAQIVSPHPGVMYELVAYYAVGIPQEGPPPLTGAEMALHFPHLRAAPQESADLYGLLREGLRRAVARDELPQKTDTLSVLVILMNVYFATFVTARMLAVDPEGIGRLYRRQLDLVWAGVRHASQHKGQPGAAEAYDDPH